MLFLLGLCQFSPLTARDPSVLSPQDPAPVPLHRQPALLWDGDPDRHRPQQHRPGCRGPCPSRVPQEWCECHPKFPEFRCFSPPSTRHVRPHLRRVTLAIRAVYDNTLQLALFHLQNAQIPLPFCCLNRIWVGELGNQGLCGCCGFAGGAAKLTPHSAVEKVNKLLRKGYSDISFWNTPFALLNLPEMQLHWGQPWVQCGKDWGNAALNQPIQVCTCIIWNPPTRWFLCIPADRPLLD